MHFDDADVSNFVNQKEIISYKKTPINHHLDLKKLENSFETLFPPFLHYFCRLIGPFVRFFLTKTEIVDETNFEDEKCFINIIKTHTF